jgi:DNA repair exonuclease SbcCD ATPase subunit
MNNKVKLKKLILKGFRGDRKGIWLNFEDDNKSIVLFGNNGDGKSSFSDAIEWFFTDKIDYLQREGCGRDDYFNIYMPPEDDATVRINFNDNLLDSQKTLKRKGGSLFSNTTSDFKDYIRESSKDSFILRHHTMREFIDKTKKEKLERVEEIIGFSIVKESREALLKALNSLKDDGQLISLRGQLTEKVRDLISTVGKKDFSENDVLDYADQLAKRSDSTLSIVNDCDFKSAIETLDRKIKTSDRGKELLRLDELNESLPNLPEIRNILREMNNVLTHHNELAKQQETIKASAIEKLYKAAIEAIENKLVKSGECPICKKPVDTELLLKSLTDEIEEIKKVLKERNQVIQNAKFLSSKVPSYQTNIGVLLENKVKIEFLTTETSKRLIDISTSLLQYEQILTRIQQSPGAISLPSFPDDLQNLEEDVKEIQQKITQKKKQLSETDEEKKFYQNVHKLKKMYDDYIRYKEINKDICIYDKQIDSLDKIYRDFESMERGSVQKVLKTISSDVNDFFRFLHPDDNFDEVELIPTGERGIEFKLRYHGEEISPPMKILSEAHLNSLGICLFLASAKHFNKTTGFLVLDDVVTSFDTGHRRPLSRLMSERFSDTQFLLFTHDELWFEILKKDLPFGKWLFKELMKWTKDKGLDIKDSPITLKKRIKNSLDENDIQGATNKCRILIEEILKVKCENLGIRGLEFKIGSKNDQREASELISALTSYLKDNETLRDKQYKKLFDHLRASQLITNMGSHHKTLETTSLSRGDIETVLRDIDEFESLFVCTNCNTEPNIKYSARNSQMKQCECGELWI